MGAALDAHLLSEVAHMLLTSGGSTKAPSQGPVSEAKRVDGTNTKQGSISTHQQSVIKQQQRQWVPRLISSSSSSSSSSSGNSSDSSI
jgi:hypothetical protein